MLVKGKNNVLFLLVMLLLTSAIVVFTIVGYSAWHNLGTVTYIYNEYDVDICFETAMVHLQEIGYCFKEMVSSFDDCQKRYWILHESDTSKTYWTDVLVYESVEQAKEAFRDALCGKHSTIPQIFVQTRSLYRVNNCVYYTKNGMNTTADILEVYGLNAPDCIQLERCEKISHRELAYEDVCQRADSLGYIRYTDSTHTKIFQKFEYVIPPERNSCFLLVRANMALTEEQQKSIYQMLLPLTEFDYRGIKMVMISNDAFVMGDEYTLDVFLDD